MELKSKIIKSTAWYIGTRLWMQGLSWGVTLVLARLLAPEDYGLFAMAFTVITALEMFQEFGFGVSIVQRQNLSKQQINAIFWVLSSVSVVIVALTFVGAGPAAGFYNEPRLVWIIRILSLVFLMNSLGVVPYSLLTKEIDFRGRSLAEAVGVVVSAVVSLGAAYLGWGVWALILGQLSRAIARNLGMFISSKWAPGFGVSFEGMREILKFSLRVAGASSLGTFTDTANNVIIGRFLGGYNLGLYSMSVALGQNNPLHKLSTGVINQLSLPVFSSLQNDGPLLKDYFLKITRYLAVVALPMQLGMALVAYDLISVLLSEKWLPIVGFVQAFAVGGMFHVVTLPSHSLLMARDRAATFLRFAWISAFFTTSGCLIGAHWGLGGVAVAWLAVFPLLRVSLLWFSLKELDLSVWTYLNNISAPFFATVLMVGVVAGSHSLTQEYLPIERLCLTVTAGAVTYVISLLSFDRSLTTEFKTIARELLAPSTARQTSRA